MFIFKFSAWGIKSFHCDDKKPNKKPLLVNEMEVFSCAITIYFNIQTINKGVKKKNTKEA